MRSSPGQRGPRQQAGHFARSGPRLRERSAYSRCRSCAPTSVRDSDASVGLGGAQVVRVRTSLAHLSDAPKAASQGRPPASRGGRKWPQELKASGSASPRRRTSGWDTLSGQGGLVIIRCDGCAATHRVRPRGAVEPRPAAALRGPRASSTALLAPSGGVADPYASWCESMQAHAAWGGLRSSERRSPNMRPVADQRRARADRLNAITEPLQLGGEAYS